MTKYTCVLCSQPIGDWDAWSPMNAQQYAHHECSLREVVGGIGHLIAHEYWCLQQHDPDAGLTYRQSALLVRAMVDVLGVEEVSRRGASSPGVVEELAEEELPTSDDDEEWASQVVHWAESEVPPEDPPPVRRTPGSG
jgi:hypothetical protein